MKLNPDTNWQATKTEEAGRGKYKKADRMQKCLEVRKWMIRGTQAEMWDKGHEQTHADKLATE